MRVVPQTKFLDVQAWARCESGNIAIIAGLCMPVLVGFCGLATDVEYWLYQSRQLQAAADIAAFDASVALNAGSSVSDATTSATTGASSNGWSSSNGTITVNSPPKSGAHQDTNSVEVILTETMPRYFSSIFSSTPVTITTRAVGTKNGSHVACVIALGANASPGIGVSGSGSLDSPNCDIVSDSTASNAINVSGNASLTAPCVVSAGSSTQASGIHLTKCTSMTNHAAVATDPYAGVPTPSIPGACIQLSGKPATISPGYYCKGLSVNWSAATTFDPGLYYVDGGNFSIGGQANVTGASVTFFIAKGNTVAISGGATVNFSAPTGGTYTGMVFFGDRAATNGNNNISGGSGAVITGAIYFPTENVTYSGASSSGSDCTQLIASTVTVSGNANFNNTCPGDGMSTISVQDGAPGSVQISE